MNVSILCTRKGGVGREEREEGEDDGEKERKEKETKGSGQVFPATSKKQREKRGSVGGGTGLRSRQAPTSLERLRRAKMAGYSDRYGHLTACPKEASLDFNNPSSLDK